jgi:antitoxin (DNA-binding transcriptional repressor) of toxin-antitoxin stability system
VQTVGIKELKDRLTYYLKLAREGDNIIVTDRGKPVAILHNLDVVEERAGVEERCASLGKRGMLRLPSRKGVMSPFDAVQADGKPASEIILEERR